MVKMAAEQESSDLPQDGILEENSEESSDFVVLGTPVSLSTMNNSFNLMNLNISPASLQSDLSPDEVSQWINELLKENRDLKGSLEKTNITMKQQFETLQLWEKQFTVNCQQYKTMIEDCQKCKLKLQEENKELKKNIEDLKATLEDKCEELKEKDKLAEIRVLESLNQDDDYELEKLKIVKSAMEKTILELQENTLQLEKKLKHLGDEKKELLIMNSSLENKLTIGIKEISSSKINSHDNISSGSDGSFNELTMIEINKEVSPSLLVQEEQAKVSQLVQQLAEQQLQTSKLQLSFNQKEEEIKHLQTQLQSVISNPLDKQQEILADELKASEEKYQAAAISAQKYKERSDNLQHWLKIYQEKSEGMRLNYTGVIEQLQAEINNLRFMLTNEQTSKMEDRKNLEETRQQLENLLCDYKKDELQAWKELESRRHQVDLDKLLAQLVEKNEEVNRLKCEITTLEIQAEKVPILEAQVQSYKQDFEDESSARLKCQNEMDILKADLQAVYTENQKLEDKFRTSPEQNSSHHSRGHRNTRTSSQESPISRRASQESSNNHAIAPSYVCPKCNSLFTDLQPLCNHVEYCIKDDHFDYP